MNEKILTIIVPVKNETQTIEPFVKFLNVFFKFQKKVIFVVDDKNDNSVEFINNCKKNFNDIEYILNNKRGIKNAINCALKNTSSEIFCIMCVDELLPILALEEMYNKIILENFDFVSATRYKKNGKRYGGSFFGKLFSYLANNIFNLIKKTELSDLTTGIKMTKKTIWNEINLESSGNTWAFCFELSLKVIKEKYKISEVPIISADRIFGGRSSFNFIIYFKEYLYWFLWGLKNI